MERNEVLKELKTINDKIFDIEKRLSDFAELLHSSSSKSIGESESAIIDLEIDVADLQNRINNEE